MSAVAKKKNSAPSFEDVLNKTATAKAPAKKKSSMPTVETTEAVKEAVDDFNKAKKAMSAAKADMDAAGAIVIDYGNEKYDEMAFNNNFRKSFKLDGNESEVKFVTANKFGLNVADEPEVKELLGDSFDELIETKFNVTLKAEVFTNNELKNDLMSLLGDRFAEFFDTKKSLAVKTDFDKNVFSAVDKDGLDDLRVFVKPYKPSLK